MWPFTNIYQSYSCIKIVKSILTMVPAVMFEAACGYCCLIFAKVVFELGTPIQHVKPCQMATSDTNS